MKHEPIHLLPVLLFLILPLIGIAQDFPTFPEKKHTTSISLTAYANDGNSADIGYTYKLIVKNDLAISTGITGGFFYPRKKLSNLEKEDLIPFVAPNIELSYGAKHMFYIGFWKNFLQHDKAPFRSAIGYRHVFVNKQLSVKAFGNFLWIRDDNLDSSTIFTYGGIGIGAERHF